MPSGDVHQTGPLRARRPRRCHARRWWTHLTRLDGRLLSGNYPFVAEPVDPFEVESLEFLEPDHPVYALRPADPLEIVWGFYSPRASFAYPGGESVLD
ncbi:hypothetical protein [Micromonospora saelicesensis]|uniref:hypothetical protein n=1 Tax=Micromonospora saelicesensis TaxID=285676 RepID=UPI000A62EB34|nr:hypothetical protein [Micromonospora saelicesensis]